MFPSNTLFYGFVDCLSMTGRLLNSETYDDVLDLLTERFNCQCQSVCWIVKHTMMSYTSSLNVLNLSLGWSPYPDTNQVPENHIAKNLTLHGGRIKLFLVPASAGVKTHTKKPTQKQTNKTK